MSVFLRWGVFGILGFAGLMYAYNASKRLAERHAAQPPVITAPAPREAERQPAPSAAPPHCEVELIVAQRALEYRARHEPLDRLLRIQEIAWQEPIERRERLAKVATAWFSLEGEQPLPAALRSAVVSDCQQHAPPP